MHSITRRTFCLAGAAATLPLGAAAQAPAFPTRPVTILLPAPGGSTGDVVARLIASKLSEEWKQPVIVDFKPGASGMIGSAYVARSNPDGHTILLGFSQLVQAPSLYSKLEYDVLKDFTALGRVNDIPLVLVTSDAGISSLQDFVAKGRAAPGKYSYGSYGNGTTAHIYGELLNQRHNLKAVHIPYKGTGLLMTDMLAGHVTLGILDLAATLAQNRTGKVKPLAITGSKRSPHLPDVPTFLELGYPELSLAGWFGLFVPSGVPAPLAERMRASVERVARLPEVQEKLAAAGLEPVAGPEDFPRKLRNDIEYWKKAVAVTGVKID
ncbi:Bug family tripartite tricarboxylate transporter substrate binding protein [Ramlibacter sp.]|uniref:Bug family tripartite tricarboxylate transporter substrate binding protein n=1 Tax=Ramlibacter sp. TaxID=1917967 RepID=UPI003D0A5DF5